MRRLLYEDAEGQVHQWTSCPFTLEELPACWPPPELPRPLCPDAELVEAIRSSSGDVVGINEYRAFNGQWHLIHAEGVQKHGDFGNVVLFPPYAETLKKSEDFINAILNQPK